MEQLHIEKEKMFNLMENIGFSDSLIKKNKIIIDRYIEYLNDHSYQLSLESANLFSENYYTLFLQVEKKIIVKLKHDERFINLLGLLKQEK